MLALRTLTTLTTRSMLVGLVILRFSTGVLEHVALILSSMLTLSRIVSGIVVFTNVPDLSIKTFRITNCPSNIFRDSSQIVLDVLEDVQVAPNTRKRLPHSYAEEIREHVAEKACNDSQKKVMQEIPGLRGLCSMLGMGRRICRDKNFHLFTKSLNTRRQSVEKIINGLMILSEILAGPVVLPTWLFHWFVRCVETIVEHRARIVGRHVVLVHLHVVIAVVSRAIDVGSLVGGGLILWLVH